MEREERGGLRERERAGVPGVRGARVLYKEGEEREREREPSWAPLRAWGRVCFCFLER